MIARPKFSRNEWKTAEIGAFEVGNFALFCCSVVGRGDGPRGLEDVVAREGRRAEVEPRVGPQRLVGVLLLDDAEVRALEGQPAWRGAGAVSFLSVCGGRGRDAQSTRGPQLNMLA